MAEDQPAAALAKSHPDGVQPLTDAKAERRSPFGTLQARDAVGGAPGDGRGAGRALAAVGRSSPVQPAATSAAPMSSAARGRPMPCTTASKRAQMGTSMARGGFPRAIEDRLGASYHVARMA